MKVLLLGSHGQLGRELGRARWPSETELLTHDLDTVDIAVPGAAAALVERNAPDIAINAAAYAAVDKAESEPEAAFARNLRGPEYLAQACAVAGIPLIHISTDYVFDGTKPASYVEDDAPAPLGIYGRSKRNGEIAIRRTLPRHFALRTSWLYSVFGNNFVKTMPRLGKERSEVRVVADQIGAPTAAGDLAASILAMVSAAIAREAAYGIYHVCNAGKMSWHGFAQAIFVDLKRWTGRSVAATPIDTAAYPTPAERPSNFRMDCGLLQHKFGIVMRPWQTALQDVLTELCENQK